MTKRIPIVRARELGKKYEYDGTIIIGLNEDGTSWITTWGKNKKLCDATAKAAYWLMDLYTKGPESEAYKTLKEHDESNR